MSKNQLTISVGVILNDKREILLGLRHQPQSPEIHNKWEFPGGGIELNETPEKALLREVKEETGLNVKIIRLLPKIYSNLWKHSKTTIQVIILAYECKILSGKLKLGDPEVNDLKFFKPQDIDYSKCLPKTKEIIELLNRR